MGFILDTKTCLKILGCIALMVACGILFGALLTNQLHNVETPAGTAEELPAVTAEDSLDAREEIVLPSNIASSAVAPVSTAVILDTTTFRLTTSASMSSENGSSVSLVAEEVGCEPESPYSVWKRQVRAESLGVSMEHSVCLKVAKQSMDVVRQLTGTWSAISGAEVPELDASVKGFAYRDEAGGRHVLYAVALGYCESDEGGCSATVGVVPASGSLPSVKLRLGGDPAALLFFNADGAQ
jgi:transposase-like protein